MASLQPLLAKLLVYYEHPGWRLGIGVLLLALGIIYLQLPEAKAGLGLVVTVIGLALLLDGAAGGRGVLAPPPPPKAPKVEKPVRAPSHLRIEVGPPAAGS
ncbi:MAG: hypothetical protein GX442_26095 [Candidatus Riflebacteria bacterium]|nr:hypothetical protein [Candidatus Riflebacteria bacterium]